MQNLGVMHGNRNNLNVSLYFSDELQSSTKMDFYIDVYEGAGYVAGVFDPPPYASRYFVMTDNYDMILEEFYLFGCEPNGEFGFTSSLLEILFASSYQSQVSAALCV